MSFSSSETLKIKSSLDDIQIEVKVSELNSNKEQMFIITTYSKSQGTCIEVTVRKILQIEFLAQYMNVTYGGFIIPLLNFSHLRKKKEQLKQAINQISQYLSDLIQNYHCQQDQKLFEFIFHQEVVFPNIQRYDKVLSDAAIYSRRYLNTIFTRKQYNSQINHDHHDLYQTYSRYRTFSDAFDSLKKIFIINIDQQEAVEDILCYFSQILGGMTSGVQPVEFLTPKMMKQMKKIEKTLYQGHEAFQRWQILNETVKQLQCNLRKGLHEDHIYFVAKSAQLKNWSRSIGLELAQVILKGQKVLREIIDYFYSQKQLQNLTTLSNINQRKKMSQVQVSLNKIQLGDLVVMKEQNS